MKTRQKRHKIAAFVTYIKNALLRIRWTIYQLSGEVRFYAITEALLGILLLMFILTGCKTIKYVPVETTKTVEIRDTIITHPDTVYFEVPKEVYKDYAGLEDTLRLETSYARSIAFYDFERQLLNGTLENKPQRIEKEIEVQERIITRDSIITQEVPVEVTKTVYKIPKWCWLSILIALLEGLWIFKEPIISILKRFI